MTTALFAFALGLTIGIAIGVRYRANENRRLSDEKRYDTINTVDFLRLEEHATYQRDFIDRLWNCIYTERRLRLGWAKRLPYSEAEARGRMHARLARMRESA